MKFIVLHLEKNYPSNKLIYNQIDEVWSFDLATWLIIKHLTIKVVDISL